MIVRMKLAPNLGIVTMGLFALMHVLAGCTPTAKPISPTSHGETSGTTAGHVELYVRTAQLIVPGERIGPFELGARIDPILEEYSEAKLTALGRVNTCYDVTVGVTLCACRTTLDPENRDARVFRIGIEQPNDGAIPAYRTREGIGLNSSASEVRKAYGDPSEIGESFDASWILYESFPEERFDGLVQFVLTAGEESGLRNITIGIPRGDTGFCELE